MPDTDDWREAISRRKAIQVTALGGAGLLAGCTSGNNNPGEGNGNGGTPAETVSGNGNGSDTTVYDAEFVELDRQGTTPMNRHFNPWNPSDSGCWFPGQAVFNSLAKYIPASDENLPLIAKSWEMPEEQVLEVELSDEYTWHNGDQFVADDWTRSGTTLADEEDDFQIPNAGSSSVYNVVRMAVVLWRI
jgi:peptide/nickel transport system substrate-binding protein